MKTKMIIIIFAILLIFIFTLNSLTSHNFFKKAIIKGEITKIELLKDEGFGTYVYIPVKKFKEKDKINKIKDIINKSKEIEGILDVAMPEYNLKFFREDNKIITLFIWLDGNENGMCMLSDNSEKGYRISRQNKEELKKILFID